VILSAQEQWLLRRRFDESLLAQAPWLDPIAARVLYARHYDTVPAIQAFLAPPEGLSSDPLTLPDIAPALARIAAAIAAGEQIVVYGDFDADGMCATALLVDALRRKGALVQPYIPDRFDEGYGLNSDALERLRLGGASLVVTVDCGVRSFAEVAAAQAAGLDLIITDHHSAPAVLPPALAVIAPKRADSTYPFAELCGAGVAYRLAQALLGDEADEYLDLVALATVADIVPLRDENRALVRLGLERLRYQPRPGLAALMQVAGLTPSAVTSTDIAFRLAPRLNAAGRLANARLGYDLLASQSEPEAQRWAQELDGLNRQRQQLLEDQHRVVAALLPPTEEALFLFVVAPDLHQGLVGLIAGRLCERHYRPAFVMTATENAYTGSARSIPGFHVTRALETCADLLERFGGHEAAAGFTVRADALDELRARLLAHAATTLSPADLMPSRRVDAIVSLNEITGHTPRALAALGPFGEGNPDPLLASRNVTVTQVSVMGQESAHLRLLVSAGAGAIKCVGWRMGALAAELRPGMRLDLLYTPEINVWNGSESLQLNLTSLRPTS
jgi:single-stranded-DNA-specific exonuclease